MQLSETLPTDFLHLRQSLNFLKGSFGEKYRTIVGASGALGVRFSIGILAIEYYTGDGMPVTDAWKGLRVILWDRLLNGDKPTGWHKMIPGFRLPPSAISDLQPDEYWKNWTKTLRQYRSKWETQNEYEIVETDKSTFVDLYLRFGRPKELLYASVNALSNHEKNSNGIRLLLLKHMTTGNIIGGIGTVDVKEVNQSYYLLAFLDKDVAPPQAGLWLINNWFLHCKKNGIRFANFGVIWAPGESKKWKGFSEFKLHFRPHILQYQVPLFKFTFSWKK